MYKHHYLSIALIALLVIAGKLSASAQTEIFKETFDKMSGTGGNDNEWSGSIASTTATAADADVDGWVFTKGGIADQCVKLGSGSGLGSAVTPALSALKGDATLTFRAGAWTGDGTTLKLSISEGSISPASVTLASGKWTSYKVSITGGTSASKITFQGGGTSKCRFFLDDVVVNGEAAIVTPTVKSITAFNALTDGTVAHLYLSDADMVRVTSAASGKSILEDATGQNLTFYQVATNPSMVVDQHVAGYITGEKSTIDGASVLMPTTATSTYMLVIANPVTEPATAGISGAQASSSASIRNSTYTSLTGQRVQHPLKGLYIVNGKKIIIK